MDRNQKTRMILLTGDGKGKTTSALGMVLRAVGHGLSVCVIQFIKQSADTGEARALKQLPGVEHHICGNGFVFPSETATVCEQHAAAAKAGFALACNKLVDSKIDMLLLDEICEAVALGLLSEQALLDSLQTATDGKIIVLTGRNATPSLIDLCDTVSTIHASKHGFYDNLPSQPGVEF